MKRNDKKSAEKKPNIFGILKPYSRLVFWLVVLSVFMNCMTLVIPKLVSRSIDSFIIGNFHLSVVTAEFLGIALLVFLFTALQGVLQTYVSELAAKDLRNSVVSKISAQSFAYVQKKSPAVLLTNLTSDIDAVKMFVSQAIVSIISSVIIIFGSAAMMLSINWKLALVVLMVVPTIGGMFFFALSRVRVLFKQSQEVIDWLNKVINESILGSALIRVLNSQSLEYDKFVAANTKAINLGMTILRMFAMLIPAITFVANLAVLSILVLGGHYVIGSSMSLGDFAAFNSYVALLIFPILVVGMMSNVIAQATASYGRILTVLDEPDYVDLGTVAHPLKGEVDCVDVSLIYGEKSVLKNVSFSLAAGTKTAIIGPTAAGKSQLLGVLTGLIKPNAGLVRFDGDVIDEWNKQALYAQVGLVFQDSVIFNTTLRENIAFSSDVRDEDVARAIQASELEDFIQTLPQGLDTVVSERGSSLSGGQKQRIMLARALALNPRVLFLDDFTARVDASTAKKILSNITELYPGTTLLSVTQHIAAVEAYDQIIVLMEGELIAKGTHESLMKTSPEYIQIFESQRSTSSYEL